MMFDDMVALATMRATRGTQATSTSVVLMVTAEPNAACLWDRRWSSLDGAWLVGAATIAALPEILPFDAGSPIH